MDAQHLPATIGTCAYCQLPLYADSPVNVKRDGETVPLAHVACQVDHRRAR